MKQWTHTHHFSETDARVEKRTKWVVYITGATMAAEIIVGWFSGSMALLADGWHMGTHMFALGIAVYAYRFARINRDNPAFTFGTGKVSALAGFTSAIVLGIVAFGMVAESIARIITPNEIHYLQAMVVAVIGFMVNIGCAVLLHDSDHNDHPHDDHHADHDHNRKAAFIHVVADALTSLLAIIALAAVRYWDLKWMDPAVALVGAALISVWAIGLLRETSRILLDAGVDKGTVDKIKETLEADADNRLADLHVWHLGGNKLSVALSIVTHYPKPIEHYRGLLNTLPGIEHSTIEIIKAGGAPCIPLTTEHDTVQ